MAYQKNKTLVIGFDGASPKLIEQWIGSLPNLAKFREKGLLGETIPPIPAQTPVAWTTFMTGQNPGNHGVFSFAFRKAGTYERQVVDPQRLESKTLWNLLSAAGKRVGVVNVPMCDIENLNGFIIPGFMSTMEGVPHPASLKSKIEQIFGTDRLVGDLPTDVLDRVSSDPDRFFEEVNRITDEMADICFYLVQEEEWDFFMAVFMGMDRIQHFFWKHVDSTHPKYEENMFSGLVKDFYLKADRIIGNFQSSMDENTLFMVLSDHGFCPVFQEVIVNNYLEEAGFLVSDSSKVNLEKSKAVSYGYGDIWLNVKGREPNGIIDPNRDYDALRTTISDSLRKVRIDGKKPIKDTRKREELYWGKHLQEAPDLTILFNPGWQAARQPEITQRNELKRYVNDSPRWDGGHDGAHDAMDVPGILGILGPRWDQRSDVAVQLSNIAPTILTWMGVQVPKDMDGKPMKLQPS
ncbi:MAG TPA: alkaline phosphatase family protein [Candidatus Bathyarchaeia archaeon]|nr:alkaline phosphatase family protein [Candidatus Bathyarchaeia archaeon]